MKYMIMGIFSKYVQLDFGNIQTDMFKYKIENKYQQNKGKYNLELNKNILKTHLLF